MKRTIAAILVTLTASFSFADDFTTIKGKEYKEGHYFNVRAGAGGASNINTRHPDE